jgi:poly-gamma-glutamate synthesis protein (capsule biosynthesis protein)
VLRTALAAGLLVAVVPAWAPPAYATTALPAWAPPAYATTALPVFTSSVRPLDAALKERMVYSWRKGCPVKRANLRYLRVSYVRFDGAARQGELVAHQGVAADVVEAFHALYDARFPIRRMRLVDDSRGSDDASMAADNTSAFNCRRVTGGSSWSEHSYGRALDINPVRNPYVAGRTVAPPAGKPYVARSPHRKGMVTRAVRNAFSDIGWTWGGSWTSLKDYQHFSASGR